MHEHVLLRSLPLHFVPCGLAPVMISNVVRGSRQAALSTFRARSFVGAAKPT